MNSLPGPVERLRWLAAGIFAASIVACRPGEAPREPRPAPAAVRERAAREREAPSGGRAPAVRVGIVVAADSVRIAGPAELVEQEPHVRVAPGDAWTARVAADGALELNSPDGRSVRHDQPLRIRGAGGVVRVADRSYRGELLVRVAAGGRVTVVNLVDLEEYLLGVVPLEIGRRAAAEIEAVKAQAVAARTYAIGNLGAREPEGFDFYATVMDQLYRGVAEEDSVATRAVLETRGQIVTHDGAPILAYYSSTCGGRTAAIEESWPWRAPLPYLKSVSDAVPGSDRFYCDTSNRFRWATSWTRADLLAVLGETLMRYTDSALKRVQRVTSIELSETGTSGRATVRLSADGSTYTLRADSVRWVLRTAPGGPLLNSSKIDAIEASSVGGEVAGLEIRGGGWGHGIGMCQVGALGRARAGQRHDEILKAYYTGTQITKAY